jgi:hypothetical protein
MEERRPLLLATTTTRFQNDADVMAVMMLDGRASGPGDYQSCRNSYFNVDVAVSVNDLSSFPKELKQERRGTTRQWRNAITFVGVVISSTILMMIISLESSPFFHKDHTHETIPLSVLLGSPNQPDDAKKRKSTKKGGKVVVVQIIKIRVPQPQQETTTDPYSHGYNYFYPPPPQPGGYYNNYGQQPPQAGGGYYYSNGQQPPSPQPGDYYYNNGQQPPSQPGGGYYSTNGQQSPPPPPPQPGGYYNNYGQQPPSQSGGGYFYSNGQQPPPPQPGDNYSNNGQQPPSQPGGSYYSTNNHQSPPPPQPGDYYYYNNGQQQPPSQPGGSYYYSNGQQASATPQPQPIVTSRKRSDPRWKKYRDRYAPPKHENEESSIKKAKKATKDSSNYGAAKRQGEMTTSPTLSSSSVPLSQLSEPSSSSSSVPATQEQNEGGPTPDTDDTSNRRISTEPYNWQQWVNKGSQSATDASSSNASSGSTASGGSTTTHDQQRWTTNMNGIEAGDGSSAAAGGYDQHLSVDKYRSEAPSSSVKQRSSPSIPTITDLVLSKSPTKYPLPTPTIITPLSVPSRSPTRIPSLQPTYGPSSVPATLPTAVLTVPPTFPTLQSTKGPSSHLPTSKPSVTPAVVVPARLLDDTFSIEVNVSCNTAFWEPVFHDFIEEQRVTHTLAVDVGLEEARQIAANLYQEQDRDGRSVIMYVDYDDDRFTADIVLVHGFDIFDTYREHYEFLPVPTKASRAGAIRKPAEPETKCRIVRKLSAVLTTTNALGNITNSQWLSEHQEDMQEFQKYLESAGAAPLLAPSTFAPDTQTIAPAMHAHSGVARSPRPAPQRTAVPVTTSLALPPDATSSAETSATNASLIAPTSVPSPAPVSGRAPTPYLAPGPSPPTPVAHAAGGSSARKSHTPFIPPVTPTTYEAPFPTAPVTSTPSPAAPTVAAVARTAHATVAPTERSTSARTERSTFAPTETPTSAPTESPTPAPTGTPTTSNPTVAPTFAPTETPTSPPTESRTPAPTGTPNTSTPTVGPTFAPTETPTPAPTETPKSAETLSPKTAPVMPTRASDARKANNPNTSTAAPAVPTLAPGAFTSRKHAPHRSPFFTD